MFLIYSEIHVAGVEETEQPSCSKSLNVELTKKEKNKEESPAKIEDRKNKQLVNDLLAQKSKEVQVFVNAQIFHKPHGTWSQEERSLFLKIQYKSPSAYESLKKMGFVAPGESTIRNWYNQIPFDTGLSKEMVKIIKDKLEDMNPINRKCILLLDEMTIKNNLQYNERYDQIFGYEDFGTHGRNTTPAKHALVLMLCGINKQWKQVIAHYYGTAKKELLMELIQNILRNLIDLGIDVVAVNCDQGIVL